ncbi:hypothetical protein [Rhodococcus koreensis]
MARAVVDRIVDWVRLRQLGMYDSIFGAASDSRISLDVAQTADDPGATAHMVSVNPLVGFASLARAGSGGLGALGADTVAVKLVDPVPTIDLYAVWRTVEVNPAVSSFLDCLDDFVEKNRTERGLIAI